MIKMEIKGMDELIGKISVFDHKIKNNLEKELKVSVKKLKNKAKSKAPEKTGNLKKNIRTKVNKLDLYGKVYLGSKAFYGKFIEFGTVKQFARPFLFNSYEEEKTDILNRIKKAIKKVF